MATQWQKEIPMGFIVLGATHSIHVDLGCGNLECDGGEVGNQGNAGRFCDSVESERHFFPTASILTTADSAAGVRASMTCRSSRSGGLPIRSRGWRRRSAMRPRG